MTTREVQVIVDCSGADPRLDFHLQPYLQLKRGTD